MMLEQDFTVEMPALSPGAFVHGFRVERVERVPEISGCVYVMRHQATGARLAWLACDDDDKAFAIAFKTPPADGTGVFHINEHSVLCGSDRFPVKEPFVNLLKTSMQTFLNAMTFPDKTVYPVSSTNERDLMNLMDVYLDAVLHPSIYRKPRIFEQEGWHYEVDGEGSLVRNGVVYNEMKGALSNPDRMLVMQMNRALFPDTAYGFESGGDPQAIASLSYEDFLDANARHYRLDNSYTVLYGNIDIDAMLAFIGERFDGERRRDAGDPNPLDVQHPVQSMDGAFEMRTAPENAAVGLGYVFATADQRARVLAMQVLLDAVMGSNEAPLKRAILRAGLGDDAIAFVMDGQLQHYVFLELKGAKPGASDKLVEVVEATCGALAEAGIDRKRIESALAQVEFALREGDRGYSDGVALALQALDGWLYDEGRATDYLRYEDALAEVKAMADDRGFERLLKQVFLGNAHRARVVLNAVGAGADGGVPRELDEAAREMGEEGLAAVRAEADALRAEQEAPDSPEALATLPQLHVADIGPERRHPQPFDDVDGPLRCIAHELPTHGIDYAYRYFPLDGLSWEELPYAQLLALLLGKLGTRRHDAAQLEAEIDLNLGSLGFSCEVHRMQGTNEARPLFVVGASSLASKVGALAALPHEVCCETLFDDRERVSAVLSQRKLGMEQSMASAGDAWALQRLGSYSSRAGLVSDHMGGIDFYLFLRDLVEHFDDRYEGLVDTLSGLCSRIFTARGLASFTGSSGERRRYLDALGALEMPSGEVPDRLVIPDLQPRSEAFIIPADVCFVARGGEGRPFVPRVSGAWLVASRVLSLDYLWNEVRVKGGAYGCSFSCTVNGRLQYSSYRDPGIDATLSRYAGSAGWLSRWRPSPDAMEGFVVSGVAKRDAPLKPRVLARRQDGWRFSGVTEELRSTLREEMLACTPRDVRMLADALGEVSQGMSTCVFGGKAAIAGSSADLDVIDLFSGR